MIVLINELLPCKMDKLVSPPDVYSTHGSGGVTCAGTSYHIHYTWISCDPVDVDPGIAESWTFSKKRNKPFLKFVIGIIVLKLCHNF